MPGFRTVAVLGQASIVAESSPDTLNIIPSSGISITSNPTNDTLTFAPTFGTTAGTICQGNDSRIGIGTPTAHATTHSAGGSDAIKLDALATPDDVTTLNATTTRHGLLKKLSNSPIEYMNGTGNWTTPSGQLFTNVKDYGAVGNDSTLNDTAFANAIAAHQGRLYFPAGTYRISSTVVLNRPGIYFGDGSQTVIKITTASSDAINVTAQAIIMRDLTFQSATTRTNGAYVKVNAPDFRLSNFWMVGFLIGVQITASAVAVVTIEGGRLTAGVPGNGVAILIESGVDITVRDISVDGASNIASGIRIKNSGDVTIEDCNIIHCIYGLEVSAQAGSVVASVWAVNSFFDNCGSYAAIFYADGGGAVVRATFTQCWFSSSGSSGVMITSGAGGGNIDGIDFIACQFYLNSGDGITLNTTIAKNVRALSSSFAQNGGAGFSTTIAHTGRFSVCNCRLGNSHGFSGNAHGVYITAGSANYIVTSNDATGNAVGSITDLGSAPKVVANNL